MSLDFLVVVIGDQVLATLLRLLQLETLHVREVGTDKRRFFAADTSFQVFAGIPMFQLSSFPCRPM